MCHIVVVLETQVSLPDAYHVGQTLSKQSPCALELCNTGWIIFNKIQFTWPFVTVEGRILYNSPILQPNPRDYEHALFPQLLLCKCIAQFTAKGIL